MSTFYTPPAEPSLFVYESVELELSLTTVTIETDEMVTDDFSCPIRLHQGERFFGKISDGAFTKIEIEDGFLDTVSNLFCFTTTTRPLKMNLKLQKGTDDVT